MSSVDLLAVIESALDLGASHERARWQKALGHDTPDAAWIACNRARAVERRDTISEAQDVVLVACKGFEAHVDRSGCDLCSETVRCIRGMRGGPGPYVEPGGVGVEGRAE